MRILISGICGHMGKEVEKLALEGYKGASIVAGVDFKNDGSASVKCAVDFDYAETDVDCIIDFSNHACTKYLLDFAVKNNLPLVLATTGQTEEEKESIKKASEKIPLFYSANYSMGIAILTELAKKTAALMPDAEIEIIEKHHDRKVDAPSGTALALADAIKEVRPDCYTKNGRDGSSKRGQNEIGIHSVRLGNIVGEHEVIIGTQNQTITLKHEAHSRALFAEGALCAAAFLMGKPAGLYDMKKMLEF
ncbi:MAG: 4-hydroxy-tetrahydrodipicolinate reductase [Clostridia bacterium]|nr:4-hydroxy-tetrahydrodipicolinate reductase [Clostridia bacterium]